MPGITRPPSPPAAVAGCTRLFLVAALVLAATACRPPPETPTDRPPEPQVGQLRDAIQQPLDEARDVQRTLDDGAARQRDMIDAAERGG
ncbi:hypothetical protein LDO26_03805 [Luteimonas sp. BDR2-5]|uniref:hypothetical protein n=1 Tax=Proluteimonas luteida TaxID=2878685 RepID=UPI001E5003FD|nr:hypothetical protein [Luteimonas sp. BDR2-5]MCD9027339.1 hypothetical protein [Luteimonas sp. BDR2-5]